MEVESHFRQFAQNYTIIFPQTGENTHENTKSIFLDFPAFITQKVYMLLLHRRGIPTMLKRTQNHKEAFHIATSIEL